MENTISNIVIHIKNVKNMAMVIKLLELFTIIHVTFPHTLLIIFVIHVFHNVSVDCGKALLRAYVRFYCCPAFGASV